MKTKLIIETSEEELNSYRKELLELECSKLGDKKGNCVLSGKVRPNECWGCKNEHTDMICKCKHQIQIQKIKEFSSCVGCFYENYDNEYLKDPYNVIKEYLEYSLKEDTDPQNDKEKAFDNIEIIIK